MKSIRLILSSTLFLLTWSTLCLASVTGPCSNCHTMHNSQGGTDFRTVTYTDDEGVEQTETYGVKGALTIGGCVGCHTGDNSNTTTGAAAVGGMGNVSPIPYVMSYAEPTYGPEYTAADTLRTGVTTLAGGNFYWVATGGGADPTKGHNVTTDSLAPWDMNAPGLNTATSTYQTTEFSSGVGTMLTCAGTMGCHGVRTGDGMDDDYASLSGAHHGDDTTIDGSTVAKSFRFLKGINGVEDSDWEYTVTSTDHNGYLAQARSEADSMTDSGTTISSLCGQCHGDFHSGTSTINDGGAWLRHPTDYALPTGDGSEYTAYARVTDATADPGTGIYNIVAPVGLASPVTGEVTSGAIVTCISCHRAHGSPYADLLRWEYTNTDGNGGISAGEPLNGADNNGCFACHTEKDD